MKVGFIAPYSVTNVIGGLRTQIGQTASALEERGIQVEWLYPWNEWKNASPDIVHVFYSGEELTPLITHFKNHNIPVVLSPVFFSNRRASAIRLAIKCEPIGKIIGMNLTNGFRAKAINCKMADHILPNTQAEAKLISEGFSIPMKKLTVVPNAVEMRFMAAGPDLFHESYPHRDFILFAGQAGAPRKGLLHLLQIADALPAKLVVIGDLYEDEYSAECFKWIHQSGVLHIPSLRHDDPMLESAFAACKVFVLPSMFETPGIAAMEAALAGAGIVITPCGGTREYFKDFVSYAPFADKKELLKSIKTEFSQKRDGSLKNHITANFNWQTVASKTADVYKELAQ